MSRGHTGKTPSVFALLLLVGTAGGCASWNLPKQIAFWDAPPKPQVPTRMVEFWSEETLTTPGMPSVRGFAGRVMFYNDKQSAPITVDGTFSVFAFDDSDQNRGYTAPEKKFVYLPDQLPKYYSKSELGRSYSFWLPWDEVGGPERKLCLIARFEPRKGTPVVSQPCHKLLPGTPPAPGQPGSTVMSLNRSAQAGDVRQVSYEAPVAQTPPADSATTFTIDVPPSFARRSLSAASQQADEPNPQSPTPQSPSAANPTSRAAITANAQSPTAQARESRPADSLQNAPAGASPSDRYARSRYPALRAAALRSATDHVRRQPLPATLQSRLPPTPRSDRPGEVQESPPTDAPPSR